MKRIVSAALMLIAAETLVAQDPAPQVVLVRESSGVSTDVLLDGTTTGWVSPRPGAWSMKGTGAGGPWTVQSAPVDLSTAGEVYFSMMMYHYETSNTSNFEANDNFGAKLGLTFDDNSVTAINLIPADLDTDANGILTGGEFAPGRAPAELVFLSRTLTAVIPAGVKSARLMVSGSNDSTTENFLWGNARISDIPPGSDADHDGQSREDELLAGTDPADGQSLFRSGELTPDTSTGTLRLIAGLQLSGGKHYMLESSTDAATWVVKGEYLPAQSFTGAIINLDTPQPPVQFYRFRVVP